MKVKNQIILVLLFLGILSACNSGEKSAATSDNAEQAEHAENAESDNSKVDLEGSWKLQAMLLKDGTAYEMTACDSSVIWNFTDMAAEPLGDGTQVAKLIAVAPESCEYYGFEAKWTEVEGNLFISTTRIGGMGGKSFAGMFKTVEKTSNKLVISSLGNELTLVRQ